MPEQTPIVRDKVPALSALGATKAGRCYLNVCARENKSSLPVTHAIASLSAQTADLGRAHRRDWIGHELADVGEHPGAHRLIEPDATAAIARPVPVPASTVMMGFRPLLFTRCACRTTKSLPHSSRATSRRRSNVHSAL
jgi:hypothetical protein